MESDIFALLLALNSLYPRPICRLKEGTLHVMQSRRLYVAQLFSNVAIQGANGNKRGDGSNQSGGVSFSRRSWTWMPGLQIAYVTSSPSAYDRCVFAQPSGGISLTSPSGCFEPLGLSSCISSSLTTQNQSTRHALEQYLKVRC